jgi:uncharacterized protein
MKDGFTVRGAGTIVLAADKPPLTMRLFSLRKILLMVCLMLGVHLGVIYVATAEDIKSIHPSGYVTDLAGAISGDAKERMEALGKELQDKTGAQMAIVTVKSLEGESVEDYAVDLFKQLRVGSKKDSDGFLLLVSPNERKYRIEVGYGLEPVINDARAGDAGRAMVPFLRQNDYSQAIETGAWQLAKYVADSKGVTLTGQPVQRPVASRGNYEPDSGVLAILGIVVFLLVLAAIGIGGGGRGGGSGWLWFILGMMMNSSGGGSRGGWGGGGFGGSSGGGGFGGFGGGSSGGGGASGSW